LLGLAYFWCGSQNAVELQLWSTWIVYALLIDLCDEVAGLLKLPFERISVEMVFRSAYYYTKAVERGDTRSMPEYLAYTFLQWRLNHSQPEERFKVVADVIRHHRQSHARRVLEAACQSALVCEDVSQVIDRFVSGNQSALA
jgi:hypothetical protein